MVFSNTRPPLGESIDGVALTFDDRAGALLWLGFCVVT
jgi:hypothetical protein